MKRLNHNLKFHPLWNSPKKYFSSKWQRKINPINLCPSTVNTTVFSLKLWAKYYPCKGCKFTQANADALAWADLIKNWNSCSVAYSFSSSGTKTYLWIVSPGHRPSYQFQAFKINISHCCLWDASLGTNEGSVDHWLFLPFFSFLPFAKLNWHPPNHHTLTSQDPFTILQIILRPNFVSFSHTSNSIGSNDRYIRRAHMVT